MENECKKKTGWIKGIIDFIRDAGSLMFLAQLVLLNSSLNREYMAQFN
jgi:hypothetical protein